MISLSVLKSENSYKVSRIRKVESLVKDSTRKLVQFGSDLIVATAVGLCDTLPNFKS